MPSLPELLTSDARRDAVVDDTCSLIDEEVKEKSGLSGLAIKAGYGAVKGIKPGFVKHVVTDLIPEFAKALDPLFQEAVASGQPLAGYLSSRGGQVAEALLAITDAKAQRAKSGVVKGTYDKLRGSAKKNVEAAVPRLAGLVAKYSLLGV